MARIRKPDSQFFKRLKAYNEAAKPAVEKLPVEKKSAIRRFKDSDWWLWAEVAALAFLIPTAIALWIDLDDRQLQRRALTEDLADRETQRRAQAWELVTRPAPGNAGKGPALEYLNSQGIPFTGIDLSETSNGGPAYLLGVQLEGADLRVANLERANLGGANLERTNLGGANLNGANLRDAKLQGADLRHAKLQGASLNNANLEGTDLLGANLRGAILQDANLEGADLLGANLGEAILVGANLEGANKLTQVILDQACGDDNTQLPDGLTIKPCPQAQ